MRRFWAGLALALLVLGLVNGAALAQDFPQPQGYVSDFAGLLSDKGKADLEARLVALETDTSVELAVVTVTSLSDNTIDDYAVRLFEAWGIGKRGQDNGVLFLIAPVEREVRIEVGYGLEGVLTDGRAGRILDEQVLPHFREGNYENGIIAGVTAIEGYARGGLPPTPLEDNPVQDFFTKTDIPLTLIIVLGIITVYIVGFMARTKSVWLGGVWGLIVGIMLGLAIGGLLLVILLPIVLAVAGTLLDILLSRNYRGRKSLGQPTSWGRTWGGFSGPSGGSHFGGFGGGRSGGGGAGRGW